MTAIVYGSPVGTAMGDLACRALAAFIAEGRPDWQSPGIVAALRADRDRYDPWQLAIAMLRRAADPANRTPQLQPFDHTGRVTCRRHPNASTRTDGRCSACHADALAVEYVPRSGEVSHPLRAAVARESADA